MIVSPHLPNVRGNRRSSRRFFGCPLRQHSPRGRYVVGCRLLLRVLNREGGRDVILALFPVPHGHRRADFDGSVSTCERVHLERHLATTLPRTGHHEGRGVDRLDDAGCDVLAASVRAGFASGFAAGVACCAFGAWDAGRACCAGVAAKLASGVMVNVPVTTTAAIA